MQKGNNVQYQSHVEKNYHKNSFQPQERVYRNQITTTTNVSHMNPRVQGISDHSRILDRSTFKSKTPNKFQKSTIHNNV